MIGDTYHDSETNVFDLPALCIPHIQGLATPANTYPDNSITNGTVIYMHLTTSTGPETEQPQEVGTLPIITDKGLAYGGHLVAFPSKIQPKKLLEGYIDTPCVQIGEYFVSQIIDSNGIRYMYPEILAMMIAGTANKSSPDSAWERLDPLWYRDPYGRVYNSPRILALTGNYVEAVPERVRFTMTLKVT